MFQTEHKLRRVVPRVLALMLLAVCAGYGQFRETRQLTSNNIIALAGNRDTVWAATDRGLNYQTSLDDKEEWRGFEADNFSGRFYGLAFGGGGAAALISGDRVSSTLFSFWHFDHKSGKIQQNHFRFPAFPFPEFPLELREAYTPAGGVIFFDNKFWAPFKDGGVICYDPAVDKAEALRPGVDVPVSPENLSPLDNADKSSSPVLSVTVNGNSILVTTPSKLWSYNKSDGWSAFDGVPDINSNETFIAAFALEDELYSYINTKNNGKDEIALYRAGADYKWHKALNNTPLAVFPAVEGRYYALFENNQAVMFDGTEEKLTAHQFRTLLAAAGDDPDPKVNYILFLPQAGSVGTLLVATSSGLYFSKSANPVSGVYSPMVSIRHIRQVKSGESYALPGIIRGGDKYGKAVFVYELKKSGNVTIRVYDYNMSHVKTVINRERREAQTASGRSTVPSADFWDGTNKAGRMVSPGVYYYKITSTGGDRFFGKVILAK